MDSSLKGPLIFAFSKEDLGSAAKVVNDFIKDNKLLKPVAVAVNGELVDVAKLSQIAALPNKGQAISMMMAVMKLPIEKFVRTLSAPNVKLVQTLSAYKIKLEQS
jgi:large subunit ribosomal protein L10